mgnify:CR=1 FL=1
MITQIMNTLRQFYIPLLTILVFICIMSWSNDSFKNEYSKVYSFILYVVGAFFIFSFQKTLSGNENREKPITIQFSNLFLMLFLPVFSIYLMISTMNEIQYMKPNQILYMFGLFSVFLSIFTFGKSLIPIKNKVHKFFQTIFGSITLFTFSIYMLKVFQISLSKTVHYILLFFLTTIGLLMKSILNIYKSRDTTRTINNDSDNWFEIIKLIGYTGFYGLYNMMCSIRDEFRDLYKSTSERKWLYLGFGSILYLIIEYISPFFTMLYNNKIGTKLINDPIQLENKKFFKLDNSDQPVKEKDSNPSYSHSLSIWFFIDENNKSRNQNMNDDTVLFDLGGIPKCTYNVSNDTLNIYMREGHEEINIYSSKDIKIQKWTNIICNYDNGTMDIFIDGILVSTTNDVIPYMSSFQLSVGENNGLLGGIKNVIYNKKPFSKKEINLLQYI